MQLNPIHHDYLRTVTSTQVTAWRTLGGRERDSDAHSNAMMDDTPRCDGSTRRFRRRLYVTTMASDTSKNTPRSGHERSSSRCGDSDAINFSPSQHMLRPAGLGAAVTVVYRVAQTAARRLGWDLVSACQGGDLHAGWPLQCSSITDLSMKEKNL